jgi:tripartite-type tricarboxylate transporter receptor subunit TctC
MIRTLRIILVAACAMGAAALPWAAAAQTNSAAKPFYQGGQLKVISGFGPASGYSFWAHLVGMHLVQHLPGGPSAVVQNMIGASGLKLADYMYTAAPKDGREIGAVARELPAIGLFRSSTAMFDVTKFGWLGSPTSDSNICVVSRSSPAATAADLFSKEITVGTDGAGSGMHIFPVALNMILGTRFKVIDGYSASGEVLLAIDRGELDGACQSVETLMRTRGDALKSGALRVLLQGGVKPNPQFANVPFVLDLAKTVEQREALEFLYAGQAFGRPYLTPPGLPAERLSELRRAFGDTMRDRTFLDEVSRQGLEVSPISGEDMQAMIVKLAAMPLEVISKVSALMAPSQSK